MRLSHLVLTLFYLAGPLLVISELFTPTLSIPILVLGAAYIVLLGLDLFRLDFAEAEVKRASQVVGGLAAFALSVAWVLHSGIGSFAICRWDYVKHNLIFSYLLDQRLPIFTSLAGQDFIVHYSFAYYISPVRLYQLAHALAPSITLNSVLLAIYSLSLFLATSLLYRGRMTRALVLLAILCLAGGLDTVGMLAFGVEPRGEVSTFWGIVRVPFNLDWWGIPYAPQSFTMNLYYAPQHFFAALIGTALVYACFQSSQPAALRLIESSIVITASVFWSPYVAVGLTALALVLALSFDAPETILQRLRREGVSVLAPSYLIVLAFAVVLTIAASLFLLASKSLSFPQLIFHKDNMDDWLITYGANYAPYLLALILVAWPFRKFTTEDAAAKLCCPALPKILAGCLAASGLLLAFGHGFYNDWGMRATLPLSIGLAVGVTQVLFSNLKRTYLVALLAVLAVSSASSLSEIARSMIVPTNCKNYGAFRLEDMRDLAPQYEGRSDSLLYRHLVR